MSSGIETVIIEGVIEDDDASSDETTKGNTSSKPKNNSEDIVDSSDSSSSENGQQSNTSSRKKVIFGSSNTEDDEDDVQDGVPDYDPNYDMNRLPAKTENTVRVLVIGNSYSVNTTQFVSRIGESVGVDVSVCTLYFAGCLLSQHVDFYKTDAKNYTLYEDSIAIKTNCTMKDAFNYQDYDYVAMLQSPTGCDQWSWYNHYIQALNDIVKVNEP